MALLSRSAQIFQKTFQEMKDGYFSYVRTNPEYINQIEKSIKALSYALEFLPKNYENSIYLTEILNSANNLFSYLNDCIIRGAKKFSKENGNIAAQIKQWLILVEFTQAFIEITAKRLGGNGARWAVVAIISIIKATLRLILLYRFKSGIQTHPFIKPLDKENYSKESEKPPVSTAPYVYTGPRSGIQLRTLADTPPLHMRTWESPPEKVNISSEGDIKSTKLNDSQTTGEALHVLRPLIHLTSVAFFGTNSFVPWLVALTTDASAYSLVSNQMSQKKVKSNLNSAERSELQRRAIVMFLYILRSPVYDRRTKTKVLNLLETLSSKIPMLRFILQPLAKYLPVWQQYYFYSWMQ